MKNKMIGLEGVNIFESLEILSSEESRQSNIGWTCNESIGPAIFNWPRPSQSLNVSKAAEKYAKMCMKHFEKYKDVGSDSSYWTELDALSASWAELSEDDIKDVEVLLFIEDVKQLTESVPENK